MKQQKTRSTKKPKAIDRTQNKAGKQLPSILPKTIKQEDLIRSFQENIITIAAGPGGSGKTMLSIYHASKELFTGRTKQIILIRAYQPLAGRSIGFLPGELEDKLLPYYAQMLSYLEDILGKAEVEIYRKSKTIEICSLETIRGRSWDYATIIVDEAQNLYPEEIRALTTRIGEGSQLLLLGDDSGAQTDIRNKTNGLDYLLGVVQEYQIPDVGAVLLGYDDILRSDITKHFVIAYDKEMQKEKNKGEKFAG